MTAAISDIVLAVTNGTTTLPDSVVRDAEEFFNNAVVQDNAKVR